MEKNSDYQRLLSLARVEKSEVGKTTIEHIESDIELLLDSVARKLNTEELTYNYLLQTVIRITELRKMIGRYKGSEKKYQAKKIS